MPHDDVVALFTELAAIPSPPGDEREVADRVSSDFHDHGLAPHEDDAGPAIGSTMGNMLCRIEPTAEGTPLFFCAHLDTVPPQGPIEPVIDDGFVRNAGGTILGADNKAAVAAMLEATRVVLAQNRPHAGIELLFTAKEELGLIGAFAFDHTRLRARAGYVYDMAAPIGTIVVAAPSAQKLTIRFHGRSAHSGMYPEEGRSAIAAAARAIADMRLGRIDDETTANVGTIHGGSARNIVPEWCELEAEARSLDDAKVVEVVQEMLDACTFAASSSECSLETEVEGDYRAYRFRRDALPVRLAVDALQRSGFEPRFETTGGAADANVFNERGLECVNLANGMTDIHTPDERIAVDDLTAMVDVTLALVEAARDVDTP